MSGYGPAELESGTGVPSDASLSALRLYLGISHVH